MTQEELEYVRDLNILGYMNDEAYQLIFQHCKPSENRDAVSRDEVLQSLWEIGDVGDMLRTVEKIKGLKAVMPVPARVNTDPNAKY